MAVGFSSSSPLFLASRCSVVEAVGAPELGRPEAGIGLADHHRERLTKVSAVSDEVIAARGYWTATWPHQLLALGYNQSQARLASEQTPVLVTPLYEINGQPAVYLINGREYDATIIRPDKPRLNNKDKILKYEKPFKSRNVLDLNPLMAEMVAAGGAAVWVTEGSIKADSLASAGIPCIGLSGVWNWRGRTEQRNTAPLPEWLELEVGEMVIVYDSDALTNENVLKAAQGLERHLRRSVGVTSVTFTTPPRPADGSKQGIDDYLATGGRFDDLWDSAGPVPERTKLQDDSAEALLSQILALLDLEEERHLAALPEWWATLLEVVRAKPGDCRGTSFREIDPATGRVGWKGGGRCGKDECPACLDRKLRKVILPALATWAAGRELWAGWEEPGKICGRKGRGLWLQRRCRRDYFANRLRGQLLAPIEFEDAVLVPEEQRARVLLLAVLAAPARTQSERVGRNRFIFPSTVEVFRKRDTQIQMRNIATGERKWVTKEKAEALDPAVWTSKREPDGKRHLLTRSTVKDFRVEIDDRYGERSWLEDEAAQPTRLSPGQLEDYIEAVAEPEHQEALRVREVLRDPANRVMKDEPLHRTLAGPPLTPEIPSDPTWWHVQ